MPAIAVYLAPDDLAFAPTPDWERVDTTYNVRLITIDRGRENEMSRTGVGTATVELFDLTGDFDPTNESGAFFGRLTSGQPMGPLVQAYISLTDTDDTEWILFRGFISRLQWAPHQNEGHANVTLELVDALAILAACEMAPDGSFGDEVSDGNIVFAEDDATDAVETRMNLVLTQLGWDLAMTSIFSGNVPLQRTVYAPRATVLQVIQDAADAEFPFVANVYVGGPRNPGNIVFHGRYARFNPSDPTYDIQTWLTGDDAYAEATPEAVRLSPPLVASLDDVNLYTSALATPQNVADADIAAQYVTDAVAAAKVGLRTWSAENLATFGGEGGATALEETKLMADYVVDNFASPAIRVGPLTVKSRDPASLRGVATWNLLTQVEISDRLHITTTHAGGGGFDHGFYVEGLHYVMRPGGAGVPVVELTLDVSPDTYYDGNPFPGS